MAEGCDYECCGRANNWHKKDHCFCEFYYSEALQALCTFCPRGKAQLNGRYAPLPVLEIAGRVCEHALLLLRL